MDKHLLASIYEIKGDKARVADICRNILINMPNDKLAEETLHRLSTGSINTDGINKDMCDFFTKATNKDELNEIERWLVGN